MNVAARLPVDRERLHLLGHAVVVSEPGRCVQCGICAYGCPMGIDIRRFSREGLPVADPRCILCGSCVARCPRGTLRLATAESRRAVVTATAGGKR